MGKGVLLTDIIMSGSCSSTVRSEALRRLRENVATIGQKKEVA